MNFHELRNHDENNWIVAATKPVCTQNVLKTKRMLRKIFVRFHFGVFSSSFIRFCDFTRVYVGFVVHIPRISATSTVIDLSHVCHVSTILFLSLSRSPFRLYSVDVWSSVCLFIRWLTLCHLYISKSVVIYGFIKFNWNTLKVSVYA